MMTSIRRLGQLVSVYQWLTAVARRKLKSIVKEALQTLIARHLQSPPLTTVSEARLMPAVDLINSAKLLQITDGAEEPPLS